MQQLLTIASDSEPKLAYLLKYLASKVTLSCVQEGLLLTNAMQHLHMQTHIDTGIFLWTRVYVTST